MLWIGVETYSWIGCGCSWHGLMLNVVIMMYIMHTDHYHRHIPTSIHGRMRIRGRNHSLRMAIMVYPWSGYGCDPIMALSGLYIWL